MSYRYGRDSNNSDLFAYDWIWKIVVTGDSGVGKSSFISYYSKGVFPQNQPSTVGVQYEEKKIEISEKNVKLQIWDTAGQERFKSLVKSYYRGACAVLLMYDVTNRQTFDNCGSWLNDLTEQAENRVIAVLIGNKIDLIESKSDEESKKTKKREVSIDEALAFARQNHLFFIETSAKSGSNVEDVFVTVTNELIRTHQSDAGVPDSVDIMRYNTLADYKLKKKTKSRGSSSSGSLPSSLQLADENDDNDDNEESTALLNSHTLSNKYERKNLRTRNDSKFTTKGGGGGGGNIELKSANEISSEDDQCNACY